MFSRCSPKGFSVIIHPTMRILQVCSAESLGGGERHVIDLTLALIGRGHELHLAVRPGSPLRAQLADSAVVWHELPLRNALDAISVCRLAGIIQRHRIDLLHAHVARDYPICGVAARIAGDVRLVITRHHFRPLRAGWLYRQALAPAAALIAVSGAVGDRLHEAFPGFTGRIVVIPNWIDPAICGSLDRQEARQRLGITRPTVVAILGQISPLKRQDLFVEAAMKLIDDRHFDEVEFLVIGSPAPEDLRFARRLEERISAAGLADRVRFIGFLDRLPSYLSAIDIVAVPSRNEAFSLVLVEAMAAGCAVVATRVGGMAEIVEDGVTGIFIDPDDATTLSSAIARLVTEPGLRRLISDNGCQRARQRYARDRLIDRLEAVYSGCHREASGE